MIEKIILIEDVVMCASILMASSSFVALIEKYNKYRYNLDEADNDKTANMCFKVFIVSAFVAVISWLSIFVTGIIDIATK